jgi:MinD superfamily P-loop ATPase
MKIPCGVVVNRDGIGNDEVFDYLSEHQIPVLMRIPFEKEIAEGTAAGKPLIDIHPEFSEKFTDLYQQICSIAGQESRAL